MQGQPYRNVVASEDGGLLHGGLGPSWRSDRGAVEARRAVACLKDQTVNALTVDVEDYFHVTAFERYIPRDTWEERPPRVERNTRAILDLFDEFGVRATFFVLAWVAERCPALVREIRDRGHEIACHGYGHERLYTIGPDRFRADLSKAKAIIEDAGGQKVQGYRAPSFSITEKSAWAHDILIEEGFSYDSSVFPIRHDTYGLRGGPTAPHEIKRPAGVIKEFPLSTVRVRVFCREFTLPVAGGGYLRLLPLWFTRRAIRWINRQYGHAAVVYFHPWELDPAQPRIRSGLKSRFRHYQNLSTTRAKVRGLLSTFSFAPMGTILGVRS